MNRIRFCPTGKIAYVRRENAKRKVRELRVYPPNGRTPQSYYKCPECGFYHVTRTIGTTATGNRKPAIVEDQ